MQHADAAGEALSEAAHRLRRERDLRDQHDRAPAGRHRVVEHIEVDLGLTAAGHALEQQSGAVATVDRAADARRRLALLADQLRRRAPHHVEVSQRVAPVELFVDRDQPVATERLDGVARAGANLVPQPRQPHGLA